MPEGAKPRTGGPEGEAQNPLDPAHLVLPHLQLSLHVGALSLSQVAQNTLRLRGGGQGQG